LKRDFSKFERLKDAWYEASLQDREKFAALIGRDVQRQYQESLEKLYPDNEPDDADTSCSS